MALSSTYPWNFGHFGYLPESFPRVDDYEKVELGMSLLGSEVEIGISEIESVVIKLFRTGFCKTLGCGREFPWETLGRWSGLGVLVLWSGLGLVL